jgi:opacity protein-like surface antigen
MRVRNITTCALGLAAALTLWSSESVAQSTDTTKLRRPSEQRINISKGEVAPVIRIDTVYVTRYDTVRVDNNIVRVDTVTVTQTVPVYASRGPAMYWGLLGGLDKPIDNIDRVYATGWHIGTVLGWEPAKRFLGYRLGLNFTKMNPEDAFTVAQVGDSPKLITLNGDVKWNFFGGQRFGLYGVTGLAVHRYKDMATVSDVDEASPPDDPCDFTAPPDGDNDSCFVSAKDEWRNKLGWNLGGGIDFTFGRSSMFLEVTAQALQANDERTWRVPVSLGFRFF